MYKLFNWTGLPEYQQFVGKKFQHLAGVIIEVTPPGEEQEKAIAELLEARKYAFEAMDREGDGKNNRKNKD